MNDLISRQQAIDAINQREWLTQDAKEILTEVLEQLQSAQPERKPGRWIEMGKNEDGTHNLCCGVCGEFKFKSKGHANSYYTKNKYKFCGGCGAKMGVIK